MTTTPRPARPVRLVVSDIDGTLVNRAKALTPWARAAIEAMRAQGVHLAVASARPPAGLRGVIKALGIDGPVGAANGGAIIRPDLSTIESLTVPAKAVRLTVRLLRQEGLDPWLFTPDKWFVRDLDGPHVAHEAKTIGLDPIVVEDFADADVNQTLKLVAASHDHPLLAECEKILHLALKGMAQASRSQAYYLDVTNISADKGMAVRAIARNLGVPMDQVLTIGDGANDVPMFRVGAFSVAMGNASDAVKQLASAVTDSCEEDGFAKAIERFVLEGASDRPRGRSVNREPVGVTQESRR